MWCEEYRVLKINFKQLIIDDILMDDGTKDRTGRQQTQERMFRIVNL